MAISFRLMTARTCPRPRVKQRNGRTSSAGGPCVKTFEETEAHYLPTIEGTDPTQHYARAARRRAARDDPDLLVSDYPDYAALIEEGEGTAGLDLFIGDEA